MKAIAWLLVLAFAAVPARAQSTDSSQGFQYRFNGYYRNLLSTSHSFFTQDAYADDLNRLRLSFDGRWGSSIFVHIDYDNLAHFGNLNTQPDFALVRDRQDNTYLDLLHVWIDKPHAYWDTSLYRAYMVLRRNGAELTVGRQRIAWGTAFFWSPADAFNPISPLSIESDEREGVDAVQLSLRLPDHLRWSVVYAPGDGINQSTEAARLASIVHDFDVAAFVGRFQRNWVAGGTFAGQWHGAGLHGEATYTWRGNSPQANVLRFTLGSDYQVNPKFYVIGEYFYNQAQPLEVGASRSFNVSDLIRFTNGIFTLDRHFLSDGARFAVTPLFHVAGYTVVDLTGPSVSFMPEATYSLSNNSGLKLGGEIFASSPGTEFSGISNLAYLEFTVYF